MFKRCNKCGSKWENRDDFLSDKNIDVVGYQVFFKNLKLGVFLFNHSCNTTMAVEAKFLLDLHDGTFSLERNPDSRECPGRCLNDNIMSPCSSDCRCAFISEIMKVIKNYAASHLPP